MNFYRRNISKKIISLRVVSIPLFFFCVFSFHNHHNNLGYFLGVAIFFLLFVVIKDFNVNNDSVQVKKYYLFGFLKIIWTFKNPGITFKSNDLDFGKEGEINLADESATSIGCLFSIFTIGRQSRITHRLFKIYDVNNKNIFKTVHIYLNDEEYDKLFDFVNKT